MHESSFNEMKIFLDLFDPKEKLQILDVGSFQADPKHEIYKSLCSEKWIYTGLDLVAGPNVDHVAGKATEWGISGNFFDVVISGQTMEHCFNLPAWIKEIHRVLKPGGYICLIAPSAGRIHGDVNYWDYWRILPDGMAWILRSVRFYNVEVTHSPIPPWFDVIGKGRKSSCL